MIMLYLLTFESDPLQIIRQNKIADADQIMEIIK